MPHYTSTNQDFFVERVTSDFIGQIARRLEMSGQPQSELARQLDVSEPSVSQVLNLNRTNLTIKLMARYAFALGMKIAVIAYDDGDPTNQKGPVGSEIFSACWEKVGKPIDFFALQHANTLIAPEIDYVSRFSLFNHAISGEDMLSGFFPPQKTASTTNKVLKVAA